jgi:hypothetical protein
MQWKQSKKIVEHQIEVRACGKRASVTIPNVKSHVTVLSCFSPVETMSEKELLVDSRYENVDEEEDEQTGVDGITEQVLQRPDMLAALQGRLHAEMLEVMAL